MKTFFALRTFSISATLICAMCLQVSAAVITNGGFESGFAGWTIMNQVGSDGTFLLQTGTASPVTGDPVPAPPGGTTAAMTDAQGPGSHVLFQSFIFNAPVTAATLGFDVFVGNRADRFATPNTLDFSTPALNQQARVDILAPGADPFSVAAADVLLNAFQTNVGDPLVFGYTHRAVDITALVNANLNTPLTLRFAETDNILTFQFGVDNVDIVTQEVPEPATWATCIGAMLGLACLRRARR
jgi:hypothetical protein